MVAATKSRTYKSGKRVLRERPVREPKLLPYKKLPDKPSELIRLALRDLEKTERSRSYKIDMERWHCPNSHCTVCFAGAVMAQTLKIPKEKDIDPADLTGYGLFSSSVGVGLMSFANKKQRLDLRNKLYALNSFRQGDVESAYGNLHRKFKKSVKALCTWENDWGDRMYPVTAYGTDKKQFKADMRRLARDLAKLGE